MRLGATEVHIVYRRGPEQMSAFTFEYEHARLEGVKFLWHTQPTRILGRQTRVEAIELSQCRHSASRIRLPVDLVVLAIGQATPQPDTWPEQVQLDRGRIVIDRATGQTSHPKYLCRRRLHQRRPRSSGRSGGRKTRRHRHRRVAGGELAQPKPTLATTFCGIPCLNPFWLASAPPTNCGEQIMRAFDAGWGGAVWKTIGEPITNVSSRYSSIDWEGRRMMGFNNIELISDRPIEINLQEMAEVKRRYPKHVVIASLMVESKRETWHDIVQRAEDAGADGLELNFGCPHGMSERGMGSAVGQVPEYCEQITGWVKEKARTPVIVKLTPNISDIRMPARAAKRGGADALSAINTINSITGIDLDTFQPNPNVDGKSSHGGYCGPAVKPIALNMVQQVLSDPAGCVAALRHRRHRQLARCCGIYPAGLRHGAGMYRGHALRLSHRRRYAGWPAGVDGGERLRHHRRLPRPVAAHRRRLEPAQSELPDRGAHPRGQVHRLPALLHRLLGWRAPVHPPRSHGARTGYHAHPGDGRG